MNRRQRVLPPASPVLPTFTRLAAYFASFVTKGSSDAGLNRPNPFLASWASPYRWLLLVFYLVAALNIVLLPLGFLIMASQGNSVLAAIRVVIARMTGDSAAEFCVGAINLALVTAIFLVVLPGIFLIHRFKLRISLGQLIAFSLGLAFSLGRPLTSATPDISLLGLNALPLGYAYIVLSTALEALVLQHLLKVRSPVWQVVLAGCVPLVAPYIPIVPGIFFHTILIVAAATPTLKRTFVTQRQHWPDSEIRHPKPRSNRNASTPPAAPIQSPLQPGQQYS